MATCIFNGCNNATSTTKCDFHKHRRQCQVPHCFNQVYARHLCVRHGGKRTCAADGCHRNARIAQHCAQHAQAPVRTEMCTHVGCDRVAHLRHKCVRHGGGRQCRITGCATHARRGGYCWRHRTMASSTDAPHEGNNDDESRSAWDALPLEQNAMPSPRISSADLRGFLDTIDLADLADLVS
ncbi:hypothetical protein SDRG_06086 [Saprolegnia diclina VS20]|uniref:Uncharacterized protein n=1 Tax=Saprolegnia diclina (strain VS20) TaxID=1156394 RepID=T0QFD4_SAPDV|nr:hypothetical protein SDRG_06086 [Saprolegnia diclina VS20]EQC36649.1 hypothetical protein SDRG_06086 [Saprolegnia diclina VS20]|eukprot:XP_008610070.1 hypothetical protein SDRG_06086 [Saprolegnia diclina VS20]